MLMYDETLATGAVRYGPRAGCPHARRAGRGVHPDRVGCALHSRSRWKAVPADLGLIPRHEPSMRN
jgi:hypothetical protein